MAKRPAGGDGPSVPDLLPEKPTLRLVKDVAAGCRACHLYKNATQTVFGEGPRKAEVMVVGEQPGDAEDLAGHPFVGPAGKLLRAHLEDAGIAEEQTYVTNAVKHFKFVPKVMRGGGKRRLHQSPTAK